MASGPGAALRCTPCPTGKIACGNVCIPACTALDQCHVAGVCDPAKQVCTNPAVADGTSCNDRNACTQTDTCQAGVCVGGNPVVCTAVDQCHVAGVCSPSTGACSNPAAADGTVCDDANACTEKDVCTGGVCAGTTISCDDGDVCTTDGCDAAGGCNHTPIPGCCHVDGECPRGQICLNNTCTPNPNPTCAGETCGNFTSCNGNSSCGCTSVAEGGGFCTTDEPCTGLVGCPGGSGDCPLGHLCLVNTCCVDPVCVDSARLCPPAGSSAQVQSSVVSGPSLFGK